VRHCSAAGTTLDSRSGQRQKDIFSASASDFRYKSIAQGSERTMLSTRAAYTGEKTPRLGKRAWLGALVSLLLICAPPAWATEAAWESPAFSLHGFGTLSISRTDQSENAEYVRDLSQARGAGSDWTGKVDSLLGIQANYQIGPRTEAVLQAITRHHRDGRYDPELTWAFLRHEALPDIALRVGRLGTEFYMLGDSRLVGYSNISMRPPPDFYGTLIFSYIDGIDVSATRPLGDGLLSGKLFAGISPEQVPFSPGLTWDLRGTKLLGGYLEYRGGAWQLRYSHAQSRFKHTLPTDELLGFPYLALVPEMDMAGQWARFASLGLVYDDGPLSLQLMLNRIKQDSPAYEDSRAGYLLAAYRLGDFTPYLGFSRSLTRPEALPLTGNPILDFATRSLVAQTRVDQHSYTLGGRWDIRKNLALKAQLDWIRGDPDATFLFKFKTGDKRWDGDMTVYSLALDFVF
jgi:hypothetical protein